MPRISRKNSISQSQIFHIINRGILRQEIFHDDQDVFNFLNLLGRYKEKFGFKVYHWCVMPNHYHLLIEFLDGRLLSKSVGACPNHSVRVGSGWRVRHGKACLPADREADLSLSCRGILEGRIRQYKPALENP